MRVRGATAGFLVVVVVVSALAACASQPLSGTTPAHQTARAGVTVGSATEVVDKDNRWRGAARGDALGAVFNGNLTEISARAARQSVEVNRPVAYQSTDGWQRLEAVPQAPGSQSCRHVHERVYQGNRLVREQIREVC